MFLCFCSRVYQKNKKWFKISLFIFMAGLLAGFLFMVNQGEGSEDFLKKILKVTGFQETLTIFEKLNFQERFLLIYFNNLQTIVLTILGGLILGFIPFLVLFLNGFFLGLVACLFLFNGQPFTLLLGILPHGVWELPALFLAGSWGLKIGWRWWRQPSGQRLSCLKNDFGQIGYLLIFLAFILAIAALIEVGITGRLIG